MATTSIDPLEHHISFRHTGACYPYVIHRTYLCGHPDEYIEVNVVPSSSPHRIQHCLVPPIRQLFVGSEPAYQQTLKQCYACENALRLQSRLKTPYKILRSESSDMGKVSTNGEVRDGFLEVLCRFMLGKAKNSPIEIGNEDNETVLCKRTRAMFDKISREQEVKFHPRTPYTSRVGSKSFDLPGGRSYILEERVSPELMPTISPRISESLQKSSMDDFFNNPREWHFMPGISRSLTQPVREREEILGVMGRNRHSDSSRDHICDYYDNDADRNVERDDTLHSTPLYLRNIVTHPYFEENPSSVTLHHYLEQSNLPESSMNLVNGRQKLQRPCGAIRESGRTTVSDPAVSALDRSQYLRGLRTPQRVYTPPAPLDHREILKERLQRSPSSPRIYIQDGLPGIATSHRDKDTESRSRRNTSTSSAESTRMSAATHGGLRVNEEALRRLEGARRKL